MMTQTLKRCGIWLCASVVVAIYTLSLVRTDTCGSFFTAISWRGYLSQTFLTLGAGLVLVFLSRRIFEHEYGLPLFVGCAGALMAALGACGLYAHTPAAILQQLLVGLWPLILLVWAGLWKPKQTLRCPALPYYLGIGVMCWVVGDALAPTPWLLWDLATLVYMVITAFWVWRSHFIGFHHLYRRYGRRLYSKGWRAFIRLQPWFAPIVAAVLILCFHQRVRTILSGLLLPSQQGGQVNWLLHRLQFMAGGWQGDFSMVDAPLIRDLPVSAPLVWIGLQLTPAAAAAVTAAQLGMLRLLHDLDRNTGWQPLPLSRVLLVCLTVQSVLGLLAELMINTSTSLGMPLLRSPLSALLLPLCIYADPCTGDLLEEVGDQLAQRLRSGLEARGLLPKSTQLPEDWLLYCPPWDGEMTLQKVDWADDMVRYDTTAYSALQIQWISQETEEDGSTRRIRHPQEHTTCYSGFPIQAAGKTYHSLAELTCGDKGHFRLYRDVHDRLVLYMAKPFPSFDEFDTMYETRNYRWYFLREGEQLTRIRTSDDSSRIYVTEDVSRLECCAWEFMLQWGYFPETRL